MAQPSAFKFIDGSTTSFVNCGSPSDTAQLTDETRVIWCRFDAAPGGNRPFLLQSGGGINANWLANGSGNINGFRDFSTTDANSNASRAAVNCTIGQPWLGALTMSAGLIRLYGGTLTIPVTEASSYASQITGVGTPVSVTGKSIQIGGFSGFGQGFPGVIWLAAWFDWEMSLAELRDVQFHPEQWASRALHFWYLGRDGLTVIDRGRNGNTAPGTTTGVSMAADNLPLIATPDKAHVAKYKLALFAPAASGFFARHYYDQLLVKGHV